MDYGTRVAVHMFSACICQLAEDLLEVCGATRFVVWPRLLGSGLGFRSRDSILWTRAAAAPSGVPFRQSVAGAGAAHRCCMPPYPSAAAVPASLGLRTCLCRAVQHQV